VFSRERKERERVEEERESAIGEKINYYFDVP
jgi:hypothetical protein